MTTTSFLADIARNIAGTDDEVRSVLPIGTDPHIYDPVPEDARLIARADLLIQNGLTLEGWLSEMMENSGTKARVLVATEGIPAIESTEHENAFDPHAWMNPRYGVQYAANIRDALIRLRPDRAAEFAANYEDYQAQLLALDAYIQRRIDQIPPEKRILATSHDAFRYYGDRYGLQVTSILGTSTEAEPTLEAYQALLTLLRRLNIPAIFVESTINPKLLEQLAEDLGIIVGGELFADSLGDEDSGADTYLKMLRQNTDLIVDGLMGLGQGREAVLSYLYLWVIGALFALAFAYLAWRLRRVPVPSLDWRNYQIDIEGLSVSYDRKTALSNVYLQLQPGHVYGLIGGNGSGKSTLFKALLGLVPTDSGTIRIHGLPVDMLRSSISYIPQKEEIDWSFPATVEDIVMMGRFPHLDVFQRLGKTDRKRAEAAMSSLGILDLRHKQIGELSGGQQQRAFIARALCQDAEIYLFDEPFVGVDIATESSIMALVQQLARDGKLVVIIHHDLAKVPEYFDQVIMINQRVIAAGPTEAVFTDEHIQQTYSGRLTILQKTESYRN